MLSEEQLDLICNSACDIAIKTGVIIYKKQFIELAKGYREATELRALAARLAGALEELMAWQNGPPLITYMPGWSKAMNEAGEALAASKALLGDGE